MEQRILGKTSRNVSTVGLGTWQLGAGWGSVTEEDALAVLEASVDENAGLEKLQGYLKQLTTLPWGEAEPRSQFRVSAPPPAVELVDYSART